jgi:hypothetical protein
MTGMTTARFALPLLQPGQAQKEMSHNEALSRVDALLHAVAHTIGENQPPETPAPGDCWIVGAAPVAAWAGHAQEIACWTEGGWRFVVPAEGTRLWLGAQAGHARFEAGDWRAGEAHGKLIVEGVQVVGARGAPIAEPSGGTTVDAEARVVIVAVLEALRTHGLIAGDQL